MSSVWRVASLCRTFWLTSLFCPAILPQLVNSEATPHSEPVLTMIVAVWAYACQLPSKSSIICVIPPILPPTFQSGGVFASFRLFKWTCYLLVNLLLYYGLQLQVRISKASHRNPSSGFMHKYQVSGKFTKLVAVQTKLHCFIFKAFRYIRCSIQKHPTLRKRHTSCT